MVETTHSAYGAGNPRLYLVGLTYDDSDGDQPSFALRGERTVIGSGPSADIHLEGLAEEHAVIIHDDNDEYVLTFLAPGETGINLHGDPGDPVPGSQVLRTGSHVKLGEWQLAFFREEYADHRRPHGGREGGEYSDQEPQPPRPHYEDNDNPEN